jgi:hypothetical protein
MPIKLQPSKPKNIPDDLKMLYGREPGPIKLFDILDHSSIDQKQLKITTINTKKGFSLTQEKKCFFNIAAAR